MTGETRDLDGSTVRGVKGEKPWSERRNLLEGKIRWIGTSKTCDFAQKEGFLVKMVKTGGFAYDRSRRIGLFADLGRIPVRELDFTVFEVKTGVFGENGVRDPEKLSGGQF